MGSNPPTVSELGRNAWANLVGRVRAGLGLTRRYDANFAEFTEHTVAYADGQKHLFYLAAGPADGPLVIFLHGWPALARTWRPQMSALAALGYRTVSPDMPGYGQSTARHVADDYCLEALVEGMLALLGDTGGEAAVWVGHDWGAAVASAVACRHPATVVGLVTLCVPYRSLELGWDGLIPSGINAAVYSSEASRELGPFDYMKHYEEAFESAVRQFDGGAAGFLKLTYAGGDSKWVGREFPTATVRRDGGWLGGVRPPAALVRPAVVDDATLSEYLAALRRSGGFWAPCAYYLHHARNAEFCRGGDDGGRLACPVLFVHATLDHVCDTTRTGLADGMRRACANLCEVTVESGHWPQLERPEEVNAALVRFLFERLPSWTPALKSWTQSQL
ncbi:hypothetical protein HK405_013006 [Cladochytrium tenue]|nr:hypothetical protein HK405_013006 [Cladochytrium tenue]